jgi:hypothetical protein
MPPLLQNTAQAQYSRKIKASALAAFLGIRPGPSFESETL